MSRAVDTRRLYAVDDVADGDTLVAVLEVGVDTLRRLRLRLVVVDTPERGQPGHPEARGFTVGWLALHAGHLNVDLWLTRTGRYVETFGRLMADVYDVRTGESLSGALLQHGHAVVWQ